MVKSIKTQAPVELLRIRQRVLRVLAMGRISQQDSDRVLRKVEDLEETIQQIDEKDSDL